MSQRITRSAAAGGKKPALEIPEPEVKKATKAKPVKKAAPAPAKAAPASKKSKKAEVTEDADDAKDDEDTEDIENQDQNGKETKTKAADAEVVPDADSDSIYAFTAKDIKGAPVSLGKYKGSVCIIVNVASKCGHTKTHYEQLVELHKMYAEDKGLKILAFPCNQFGSQEPGTLEAIGKFANKFNVKFDMFEKIKVNGEEAHPLYKFLSSKLPDAKGKADKIKWNFTKFIVDSKGKPVERFAATSKPLTLVDSLNKYW